MRLCTLNILLLTLISTGCSVKTGILNYAALGLGETRIIVANTYTTTPSQYTIAMYDENGGFLGLLADYTRVGGRPTGIAPGPDGMSIFSNLSTLDRIDKIMLTGGSSVFATDAGFTGNLQDLEVSPSGELFSVEGNTIERFSANGVRIGNPSIPTAVAGCTNLGTPKKIKFNGNGNLITVNSTGTMAINVYNVASTAAKCVSTNTSITGTPNAIHYSASSNLLYLSTTANNLYSYSGSGTGTATTVIASTAGLISAVSAIAELPDETLLIASDGLDQIDRFTKQGNLYSTTAFIKNAFTGAVTDIIVLRGK